MDEVMDYRGGHTFPSGVQVDFESDPVQDYKADLDAVATDEDLTNLRQRWSYLLPELGVPADTKAADLKVMMGSEELQSACVDKANQGDALAIAYINLLLPVTFVNFILAAHQYGVPVGTVVIQMWNAGMFTELPNGAWVMKPKETTDEPRENPSGG